MSAIPLLLAGAVGSGTQNHQADQWGPRLEEAGFSVAGVWTPPSVGSAAVERARGVADAFGVALEIGETPSTAAAGAIVCLRGAERAAFGGFAAEHGLPILLDKPTLDTTAELEAFAAAVGDAVVLPGHHFLSHPGFTRLVTAVRGAEFGLLRAVHADLVAGGGEPAEMGELRNLGVYVIEMIRAATGPATVRLQAHATPEQGAWTFLGKSDLDIVVSAHVSRAGAGSFPQSTPRAKLRLVGSHGIVHLDLAKPALGLATLAGIRAVPFGEGSVLAHLRRFAALIQGAGRTAPASDLVTLSRALDGIAASASSGETTSISW